MEKERLIRFISGNSNAQEQKEVLTWIGQSKENKSIFAQLKNINVAIELLADEHEVLRASVHVKKNIPIIKPLLVWGARIAAMVIIGLTIFHFGKENEKERWTKSSAEQFTEIRVPIGESGSVTLPDGSEVKLNSGSVLRFSKLFGEESRKVLLDGEGYFKVQKSDKRFIVNTSNIDVEVLGTVFNISAYETDRVVSASLYEGSVKVFNKTIREGMILKPEDSYLFDKVSKQVTVNKIQRGYDWMDNYFVANSDDIEVFVKKIERKYKVSVLIAPELIGKCRYTGVFKGESLQEILDNMVLASPISYTIQNKDTVLIISKPK